MLTELIAELVRQAQVAGVLPRKQAATEEQISAFERFALSLCEEEEEREQVVLPLEYFKY